MATKISHAVFARPSGKGNLSRSTMLGNEVSNVMGSEFYEVWSTGKDSEAVSNHTHTNNKTEI